MVEPVIRIKNIKITASPKFSSDKSLTPLSNPEVTDSVANPVTMIIRTICVVILTGIKSKI